ncbi:MAG: hypothetical protein JW947_08810 [Sedimentisphaerales bacterium]|nr:hypothetical protein [Sedimentisphaerales bacterium]
MKKMTLNILLFILLLTAAIVSASWLGLYAGNVFSCLNENLNESGQESVFIGGATNYIDMDPNNLEPKTT